MSEDPGIYTTESKTSKANKLQKREVSEGLKIRAVIDGEVVKGLLLINGGGAVALLAFLPVVLGKPEYKALANAVLWGLLIFSAGLVFAIVHNRLRRECSQIHDLHNYSPPPGQVLHIKVKQPTVCWWEKFFQISSLVAFIVAIFIVFSGGQSTLNQPTDATSKVKVSHGALSLEETTPS